MHYTNDHLSLLPSSSRRCSLDGLKLPNSKDVFFRAKQREIIDQYSAARLMLNETECSDWKHWYEDQEDPKADAAFQNIFRAIFYETALFYYNVVVDLSWTLCYICAEFALTKKGERVDFRGMMDLENAAECLRVAENNVTSPTADNNPFGYLKLMCPEFNEAIDKIITFWNDYSCSNIRKKYNYCKHKGKPAYEEIKQLQGPKFFSFFMKENNSDQVELPTDARDVQYSFSLNESIEELLVFDNNRLFSYLSSLFGELEKIIDPSPMVY